MWVVWLRSRWVTWAIFSGVVLLALVLNTWGLSRAGYGNTYYAAAVRSMTMSWKNFFFGAFDPGGFITVDKTPAFLWVGALSARVFGYSSWSILMPSAVAGAASVGLLWLIVRRWFGLTAATIAALVLALSPISIAVNRLNLPEPFLILALIGAAGSLLQSLESRRWWAWTAFAGFLVGVAFNTKMLAAWIPGPAFALALVVAVPVISRSSARQLLAQLAILLVVTLAVSGSWMAVVDAWPASDRPYIGGSTDNTTLDLALGYNGFGRVDGDDQLGGGGRPAGSAAGPNGAATSDGQGAQPGGQDGPSGQAAAGGFQRAGGVIAGAPGLLRLFDDANGGQIAWLLPFAIGAGLVALWSWRRDPTRRAFVVMFLGWGALYGGIFSFAQGIYHSYYTSAMAPAVAVLAGVGTVALANEVRRDSRWLIAVVAIVGATVYTQLQIAGRMPDYYGWVRPLTIAVAVMGLSLVALLAAQRRPVAVGLALTVAGLLLMPAAWTLSEAANAPLNTTLPQAGPRQGASGQTFGSDVFDSSTAELALWLKSHSDPGARWQLVVTNAQGASRLIAEEQLSVMAIGGFSGSDDAISVAEFAELVSSGDVRYVEIGGSGPGGGPSGAAPGGQGNPPFGTDGGGFPGNAPGNLPAIPRDGPPGSGAPGPGAPGAGPRTGPAVSSLMSAVESACTVVSDSSLPASYQDSIYDCAGKTDAILALAE